MAAPKIDNDERLNELLAVGKMIETRGTAGSTQRCCYDKFLQAVITPTEKFHSRCKNVALVNSNPPLCRVHSRKVNMHAIVGTATKMDRFKGQLLRSNTKLGMIDPASMRMSINEISAVVKRKRDTGNTTCKKSAMYDYDTNGSLYDLETAQCYALGIPENDVAKYGK